MLSVIMLLATRNVYFPDRDQSEGHKLRVEVKEFRHSYEFFSAPFGGRKSAIDRNRLGK